MNREFARATGQQWKFRVWLGLGIPAGVLTFLLPYTWSEGSLRLPVGPTWIAYFGITIPWMVWSAAALRCPECGIRTVWHQWTHAPSPEQRQALRAGVARCPGCGFEPPAVAAPSTTPSQSGQAHPRRARSMLGCLLGILILEGIAVVAFRDLWPSSILGWAVFMFVGPVALVGFMALGELAGERLSRVSLRISREDFSLGRIVFGVLVAAAYIAGLIWLESVLTGRSASD